MFPSPPAFVAVVVCVCVCVFAPACRAQPTVVPASSNTTTSVWWIIGVGDTYTSSINVTGSNNYYEVTLSGAGLLGDNVAYTATLTPSCNETNGNPDLYIMTSTSDAAGTQLQAIWHGTSTNVGPTAVDQVSWVGSSSALYWVIVQATSACSAFTITTNVCNAALLITSGATCPWTGAPPTNPSNSTDNNNNSGGSSNLLPIIIGAAVGGCVLVVVIVVAVWYFGFRRQHADVMFASTHISRTTTDRLGLLESKFPHKRIDSRPSSAEKETDSLTEKSESSSTLMPPPPLSLRSRNNQIVPASNSSSPRMTPPRGSPQQRGMGMRADFLEENSIASQTLRVGSASSLPYVSDSSQEHFDTMRM